MSTTSGPDGAIPERLARWRDSGRFVDVGGRRVMVHEAGPPDAPTVLLLHGFPTCSYDWSYVLPRLCERYRVIAHDHLGFGLSDKPTDYGYALWEQADVALAVWRQLGVERAHLVAHDYGTSVATELVARRELGLLPWTLDSLTLANGSVHIELAQLTATQRVLRSPRFGPVLARLASYRFFRRRLRGILGRPDGIDDQDLQALFAGMVGGGGRAVMTPISQYLHERWRFRHRWIGALTRLDVPTHILWGRRDPVAVPAIAEALAGEIPGAELTWLDALGHYPMLEEPAVWATEAQRFIDGVERG